MNVVYTQQGFHVVHTVERKMQSGKIVAQNSCTVHPAMVERIYNLVCILYICCMYTSTCTFPSLTIPIDGVGNLEILLAVYCTLALESLLKYIGSKSKHIGWRISNV